MKSRSSIFTVLIVFSLVLSIASNIVLPVQAAADISVYADSLASGWQDWSYGSRTVNLANTNPLHGGTQSIAVAYTGGWSGLQFGFHNESLDISAYDTLRFWIHGGSVGGQNIQLQLGTIAQNITPQANIWTEYIPNSQQVEYML